MTTSSDGQRLDAASAYREWTWDRPRRVTPDDSRAAHLQRYLCRSGKRPPDGIRPHAEVEGRSSLSEDRRRRLHPNLRTIAGYASSPKLAISCCHRERDCLGACRPMDLPEPCITSASIEFASVPESTTRTSPTYSLLRGRSRTTSSDVAKGSTIKRSRHRRRPRAIPFPLAPLAEQRRIVAAIEANLTRLDAGVANLERVRAKLKRYRAAVLKAACEGRLVPTEAELARAEGRDLRTRRPPPRPHPPGPPRTLGGRTTRRVRGAGQAADERQVEGQVPGASRAAVLWLGSLPEGWAWATRRAGLRAWSSTARHRRPTNDPDGVPVLRMGNIVEGRLGLDEV